MKTIGVEAALRWAYCEELPKKGAPMAVGGEPWRRVKEAGDLGTLVDVNTYGVVPGAIDEGEPHPDAVALHQIVGEISAGFLVYRPDGWAPIEDWGAPSALIYAAFDRAWSRVLVAGTAGWDVKEGLADLVRRVAILGPRWEIGAEAPVERDETARSGQPLWFRLVRQAIAWNGEGEAVSWRDVEVDGYDARRQRPHPDAYRKTRLEPDPTDVLEARIEYQIWRCALDWVAAGCEGRMAAHRVLPSERAHGPWVAEEPTRRVLRVRGWDAPVAPIGLVRYAEITEAPQWRVEVVRKKPVRKKRGRA